MWRLCCTTGGSITFGVMNSRLAGIGLAFLLLLGAVGCSADEPTGSPSASQTAAPDAEETPSDDTTIENNEPEDGDDGFTFDDAAEFPDALSIETDGQVATKTQAGDKGAEGTDGSIVIVRVLITNGTPEEYFADGVTVTATYGDGEPAPAVTSANGDFDDGFSGQISIGGELGKSLAFAVPVDGLGKVTITVDPGDEIHDAVSFTGSVEQS